MRIPLRLPIGLLLTLLSIPQALGLTVKPTMPSVALGRTVQFAAQQDAATSTDVAWSAGGVIGGNSKAGTISSAGLYTAPATMPGQNPVQVTAMGKAGSRVSATTYVYLLAPGPAISAVSPNPLTVGTIRVVITGSGFLPGATVLSTSGTNAGVQLSTEKVTATSITALGYQGPAISASFRVKNPGSDYSNSIVVPVRPSTPPPPTTYKLTVVNGSGSEAYAAGTVVTITANAPPNGQKFAYWTGAVVKEAPASTTTLVMPAANTTVTANYAPLTTATYVLTVVNGSGSGTYAAGTLVTITANTPPSGQKFAYWTGAAVKEAAASTTTLVMPANNTTVTANYVPLTTATYVLTVANGSGSGTYAAGTVVSITANPAPSGQKFVNWTGASVAESTAAATTLSMPAANTTVTANYTTPVSVSIPFPVSTHPRLWVTTGDLPRLRSWAVSSNPIYAQGMVPLLAQAVNVYNKQFFPNGIPNPNYPDPGDTQGYSGYLTEQYGMVLAFNSLIDPDPTARIQYAQYTRNMLMVAMDQAALGHMAGAPFRDPMFAVYNRANGSGEQWPLMVDWIYSARDGAGNPILSVADRTTIRKVFLMWANDCLHAYTTGGDHPEPIGAANDLRLLPGNQPYRMAANNYYLGHARLLTMMALVIDPADDPAIDAAAPSSQLGNTLRSYIVNANGAWLFQEFAMFGDASTVAASYGIPGNGAGFGLASGGLPPEGMLYGHSFGFVLGQLLALQTAGFNNPAYSGPQIQMIGAPVWDRYVSGYLSSMTPTAKVFAEQPWLGPVYQFGSYGDLLRLWVTPDVMQSFALLALLDQQNGKSNNLNSARWLAVDGVEGGAAALMSRITNPWSWGSTNSILYYLLLDPAATKAADPRPSLPTTFYDVPAGRIVAHSDWTPNGTMFDYRASWISINHQVGDAGQFELYRNGEWLTKEMSNYDNNAVGMTTMYHNTLSLQNWCANGTPNLQWYEAGEWANGSEWMLGLSSGDPVTIASTGPGYVYASSDLTKLFNRPNYWTPSAGATNITQATRSILWINNDYIVVYDRATSLNPGLFKRFSLSLVTNPSLNGNVATETLASGQKLFVQSLLPNNPSLTGAFAAGNLNPIAQLEPTKYILTVEDPGKPADTRFLHVLQGADPGASMVPAAYSRSASGTAFDGAVFGTLAVYFPVASSGSFAGTALPVPSGVHTVIVAGLAAKSPYTVVTQTGASGRLVIVTPGVAGAVADSAGVLTLSL